MNEQIKQTAITRITTDLRNALLRIIEHCRRVPHYGAVFDKPVDYVGIPLPDYLEIVKRPMDFQMLRRNLMNGEYEFLYEFLHDADLIWTNCKTYNLDDKGFREICDYMEETFMLQLDKLEVRVTPEVYKIIVTTNIPKLHANTEQFSVSRLQCLIKELCDLPEPQIAECVYFLLNQKNELNLIHGPDVVLRLNNCSFELLQQFEEMVQAKKDAFKEKMKTEGIPVDVLVKIPKKRGRKPKNYDM
ncbi:Bromodomain-containing_protein [Hexamita inflata]|uniref:Bromodomain-containing protein n=1 Tax=Hexamita inflata TaxID=28002 RepID=A0AA86TXR1_9EUKA|nr:Bromodomain-containing protein [Hexamita inflata]